MAKPTLESDLLAWIEDMQPQWLSDFFDLSRHLPCPPSMSSRGEYIGERISMSQPSSNNHNRERQTGQRELFAIGVADHDETGTAIGRDRMLHIATYWRNAADNYESAVLKSIAFMGRNHVMELLREVNRLRRIVNALPKTADGVPIYPGMHVWFYSARSASQSIDELKVVGWDWMPSLAPDAMHCINVVNEHGDEDGVNLACCYSTFDAADQARFAVKEIASRKASEADASLDEAARAMFGEDLFAVWEAMGRKTCGTCGVPLRPCPKGPGADEPGYVGFYPCKHDDEDPNG